MKTKIYAALVAVMAISGLVVGTSSPANALRDAGLSCPGTGTDCARTSDGTTYYKSKTAIIDPNE